MLQHVLRRDDLRETSVGIDHHVIRRIDVSAKSISVLPYPRCGGLDRPGVRAPRKQAHPDPEFRSDTGKRLWRQPSVRGLDQANQIRAVAFESKEAAQNPLECDEGRRSGSGRRERFPITTIANAHRAGTIERNFQV
ncbi:MAG TPA: hypothetical protein VN662_02345 [Rhodanobacteraceae bacterium]|nr:hypothetical protein [Rhodanobacteraceae bacterium]